MRENAENAYCLYVRIQTLRTKETLIYEDYSYEKEKAPLGDRGNKHENTQTIPDTGQNVSST